jgi:cytochrome P450
MNSRAPQRSSQPAAPGFDADLGAWLIARHADVAAALEDRRLVAPGEVRSGPAGDPVARPGAGAVRSAAGRAFAPDRLSALETVLAETARRRARALGPPGPADLMDAFARPWSAEVALRVAGAAADDASRLTALASTIFLAAAHATRPEPSPEAAEATTELARRLAAASPARPSRPADPQAFVALSQTLPHLLAAAWEVLIQHPEAVARLRAEPTSMPRAVEELLRLASPARAVFREAAAPIDLAGVHIRCGERVVLLLAEANRDPARFPDPDRLDLERHDPAGSSRSSPGSRCRGHLALGQGIHGCPGAPLVRLCATVATEALLGAWAEIAGAGPGPRLGGFAIDAPTALPVVLGGERPARSAAPTGR